MSYLVKLLKCECRRWSEYIGALELLKIAVYHEDFSCCVHTQPMGTSYFVIGKDGYS